MAAVQEKQCESHDKGTCMREFMKGDCVSVRNVRGGEEKWLPGVIVARKGTLSYLVRCGGKLRYVHVDHLRVGIYEEVATT